MTRSYTNNLTKYQKIIVSIYFILGITALPIACVFFLMQRYFINDQKIFLPENRADLIISFSSFMMAITFCGGFFIGMYFLFAKC